MGGDYRQCPNGTWPVDVSAVQVPAPLRPASRRRISRAPRLRVQSIPDVTDSPQRSKRRAYIHERRAQALHHRAPCKPQ